MARDPSRLFSFAALALLAVTGVIAVQVGAPSWRRIQRARVAEQVQVAQADVVRERELLAERQGSLAYRRAQEAAAAEEARLASAEVVVQLDAIATRQAEIDVRLAELSAPSPGPTPAQEAERAELVRRSGTPGLTAQERQEVEAGLAALAGVGEHERAALREERAELLRKEAALRGPAEDAAAALAGFTAELEATEARLARLEAWSVDVREYERADGAVERCETCHPGMDDLSTTHPALGADSPYQGWGCTVCHGGNGRALRVQQAHETLTLRPWTEGLAYTLEPLIDRLESADKRDRAAAAAALRALTGQEFGYRYHAPAEERAAAVARWRDWWAGAQGYFRPAYPDGLRAYGYDASGRPAGYAGSGDCLRCHEARQRRHVERWRATKFQSFARLEEVDDPTPCLRCHTTGYDAGSGTYVQPGVTCEGCHGPGVGYTAVMESGVRLQAAGRLDQGEDLLDWVSTEMRTRMEAQNVCVDCHDPFGVKDLAYEHVM